MSNQDKLQGMILDFLYRLVCQKKSNPEIFKELERRAMPPLNEDQLNRIRIEFQEKEQKFPAKMAIFRKRLGLQT